MKLSKWTNRVAAVLLVAGTIGGVAWAAGTQGSQSDPLVTLSYINEVLLPDIFSQVEDKLDERDAALAESLQAEGSAFETVELAQGGVMTLSAGSQLVFRGGTAASSAPLLDVTDGVTFAGGALVENHLYMATGEAQTVTASAAATLLVQGGYTLK